MDEFPIFDLQGLKIVKKIGYGGFSNVYLVQNSSSEKQFAAKVLEFQMNDYGIEKDIKSLNREINLHLNLQHASILQFIGFNPTGFQEFRGPTILTEYLSNGSLRNVLNQIIQGKSPKKWGNTTKYIILYGIASGMEFLHRNNIIHRDLKPENILLNDYFFPKISDFGLSKIFDPNNRSNQTMHSATPQYMAPEMLKNEDYNESVDVFSFGIIMYEIITEKYPYSNISNRFVIPHLVLKGCRPEFPPDKKIYPKIKELIEKCWSQNPSNRPSFRTILNEFENEEMIGNMEINLEDFQFYANLLKATKKSFNHDFHDFINSEVKNYIHNSGNTTIRRVTSSLNFFPAQQFEKLSKSCQKKVAKADKGDEDMMFIVGQSLLDGTNGFPQDTELGLKYLEESVEQDNDEAAELYSQLLFEGKIIEKDVEKATKMIEKAVLNGSLSAKLLRAKIEISKEKADYQIIEKLLNEAKDSGNTESMILLGKLKMKENKEKGLKRNFSDSLKNFKMAAEKGDGEGMAYYSYFLRYGFGVIDFDHKESARYAKMSADQKNMKGAALYADLLSQGIGTQKNVNLAVYYAKLSCDNNDSFGLNVYGSFLERGVGHTEQNIPESVEYFKRSAEEGSIEGLCNYGQTFYYGEKYNQQSDLKKASEYFKKSFEEGCPFAGRMYGTILLNDLGSEKNISEGIKYIKYSADIGDPESMYIYGMQLIKGQYININKDEGFRYLKMGAERQNENCIKLYMELSDDFHSFNLDDPKDQFFYGINYYLGNGVSRNLSKAFEFLTLSANQNYADAQLYLGFIYYEGKYVRRDIEKAIHYLTLAANQNLLNAQLYLGFIYCEGKYVRRDIEKAIHYLTLAANQNLLNAQLYLASIYYEGKYVRRDIEKAIHYFTLAVDQNNAYAQFNLGVIYYEGKYVGHDIEKAIHYFTLAVDQNNAYAQFNLGVIYYEGKYVGRDIEKAIHYLTLAANQNYADAQLKLGLIYYKDDVVPCEISKAIYYLTMAANQNLSNAQLYLGFIYYEGEYVRRDINRAIHYFTLAADQNDLDAQFKLGLVYSKDDEVPRNIEKAIHYFTLAANQNLSKAQYCLGVIYYENGQNPTDLQKAIYYLTIVADDYLIAQFYLGNIYYKSKYIEKDIGKAIYYYSLAADKNHQEAQFFLGSIYYEGLDVDFDIDKAIHYFKQASNLSNQYALNNLGIIYKTGDGVAPNPSESIKCINEAIRLYSNPVAMFNLAHIYFYEEAGMSDLNEAFKLLVKSASQNVIYSFELLCLVVIKKYKSLNVSDISRDAEPNRFKEDSLLIEKVIENIKIQILI